MFKLKKGNSRIVIVCFNWLVMKFPNPWSNVVGMRLSILKTHVHECGVLKACGRGHVTEFLLSIWMSLLDGVCANISEGYLWVWKGKSFSFLEPTLTFVIFNLQRYRGEVRPVCGFLTKLSEQSRNCTAYMDPHDLEQKNWRLDHHGKIKLIDYGQRIGQAVPVTNWIIRFGEDIQMALDSK
jgi:hypothetical protein